MKRFSKKQILSSIATGMLMGSVLLTSASATYDPDLGYLISTKRINDPDGGYTIQKTYSQTPPSSQDVIYDENYGFLVSSQKTLDESGGYVLEKIYTNHSPAFYTNRTYGTDSFVKVQSRYNANHELLLEAELSATFDWNQQKQITRIYNPSGKAMSPQKGSFFNEKMETSGSETQKSSAKYTFSYTNPAGTTMDYCLTLSCDFSGSNIG